MAENISQTHQLNGFKVSYGYVNDQEGGVEPAMFLYRESPRRVLLDITGDNKPGRNRMVHIICLSVAHKYADSRSGEPSDYLLGQAWAMANRWWGHGATRSDWKRVVDAIVDYLPDLVRMPPKPMQTRRDMDNKLDREIKDISLGGESIL